jgi:hypothetical protein
MKRALFLITTLLLVVLPAMADAPEPPAPTNFEQFAELLPGHELKEISSMDEIPAGEFLLNSQGNWPNACYLFAALGKPCADVEWPAYVLGASRLSNALARGMVKAYGFKFNNTVVYTFLPRIPAETLKFEFDCSFNGHDCEPLSQTDEQQPATTPVHGPIGGGFGSTWVVTVAVVSVPNGLAVVFSLPTARENCSSEISPDFTNPFGWGGRFGALPVGTPMVVLAYVDTTLSMAAPEAGAWVEVTCVQPGTGNIAAARFTSPGPRG